MTLHGLALHSIPAVVRICLISVGPLITLCMALPNIIPSVNLDVSGVVVELDVFGDDWGSPTGCSGRKCVNCEQIWDPPSSSSIQNARCWNVTGCYDNPEDCDSVQHVFCEDDMPTVNCLFSFYRDVEKCLFTLTVLDSIPENSDESATELEARVGNRAPIPTPPALGSAEYSYAYGQRPDTPGAKPMNQDEDEYHYYSKLDKDGEQEKSPRYVNDGPGKAVSPSKEAPIDHDYLVLEKSDQSETQNGSHDQERSSSEDDDDANTYFPLQKTPERPSGNELAHTAPSGGNKGEEASSSYDRLDRGEGKKTKNDSHMQDGGNKQVGSSPDQDNDHTYFPLQKTLEHPSGYEVAKTAPKRGSSDEEASSSYEHLDRGEGKKTNDDSHKQVGSSLEQDNDHTYLPLQKTPERPSGYEVAKTTPSGGNKDEESSYDRLDRGEGKQDNDGAPSDDYQHLNCNQTPEESDNM